jgi:hypothetical protein
MPPIGGTHSLFMTTRSFMSLSIGSSSQVGLGGVDFSPSADAAGGTAEIEKMLGTMLSIIERMLAQAIQQQNEIAGIGKTANSAPPAPAPADAGGANAGGGADAGGGAGATGGADAASGPDAAGGTPSIESMLQTILQMLQQLESNGGQAGGQDTSQMLQMLGEITQMLGQLQQANSAQGGAANGGAATGGDAPRAARGDQTSSIESMLQEILKMLQQMTSSHSQSGHSDGRSGGQNDQVLQMLGEITQMLQQMMPQAASGAAGK